MEEKPVKVALWCIPRSSSTVLSKCLSTIDGMEVYMELFSYAELARRLYAKAMGRPLPIDIDGNEAVYAEARAISEKATGLKLFPRNISCAKAKQDLENASKKFVLLKDMAYNLEEFSTLIPKGFKHAFLIREPSRVYASFRKGVVATDMRDKMDVSEADYDIVRHDVADIRPLSWYEKQRDLWTYVKENIDPNPVVIDAFDLVSSPGSTLKAFCQKTGLPYSDGLLHWEPSLEMPKNFVVAGENLFEKVKEFYGRAFQSQHFVAPQESGPIPRDQLTDDVIRCVDHAMPLYREMYEHRVC